ncbi:hypothetical protein SAMN02745166_00380 [Prosthecobacter debontii]|uniref:Uncharacterized protein n=1 Tax=Prosthecobacter debontii TaxID=48467 RepID=A0A1T4WKL8_9BACT|nr:hypothetical protein SAMN02745166_00380 [Prosthecobacter debontii]
MPLSIRKILFNNPWLLPILAFLTFVAIWMSFIVFAIKNRPAEVERVFRPLPQQSSH